MDLHEALKQASTPKEAEKALRDHTCLSRSEAVHVVSTLLRMGAEINKPQPAWQGLKHRITNLI